jgi:hypothetical protein
MFVSIGAKRRYSIPDDISIARQTTGGIELERSRYGAKPLRLRRERDPRSSPVSSHPQICDKAETPGSAWVRHRLYEVLAPPSRRPLRPPRLDEDTRRERKQRTVPSAYLDDDLKPRLRLGIPLPGAAQTGLDAKDTRRRGGEA